MTVQFCFAVKEKTGGKLGRDVLESDPPHHPWLRPYLFRPPACLLGVLVDSFDPRIPHPTDQAWGLVLFIEAVAAGDVGRVIGPALEIVEARKEGTASARYRAPGLVGRHGSGPRRLGVVHYRVHGARTLGLGAGVDGRVGHGAGRRELGKLGVVR